MRCLGRVERSVAAVVATERFYLWFVRRRNPIASVAQWLLILISQDSVLFLGKTS